MYNSVQMSSSNGGVSVYIIKCGIVVLMKNSLYKYKDFIR
jgi:hypothetical protein